MPAARIRAGCSPWWTRYQTSPSGSDDRGRDRPGVGVEGRDRARGEVVAVEPVPPLDELQQEQRRRVRPPVDGFDRPDEVAEVEVRHHARRHVPGRRPLLAVALVRDRESHVAGDRREAVAGEHQPFVAEVRSRRPGRGVDRPQRGMEHVAVLHDGQCDHGLIGGQRPGLAGPGHLGADEADRLGVLVDLRAAAVLVRHPDREPVGRAHADDAPPPAERDALGPAERDALEQGLRRDVLRERRDDPGARLGAGLVAEPDDARAVRRGSPVEHADRVERDLSP